MELVTEEMKKSDPQYDTIKEHTRFSMPVQKKNMK